MTGLTDLAASWEIVILLTSLTVSSSPASPALETLHTVTSLTVEAGAELTPGGPAIALTRCKYYQSHHTMAPITDSQHLLEPVNQAV